MEPPGRSKLVYRVEQALPFSLQLPNPQLHLVVMINNIVIMMVTVILIIVMVMTVKKIETETLITRMHLAQLVFHR